MAGRISMNIMKLSFGVITVMSIWDQHIPIKKVNQWTNLYSMGTVRSTLFHR